MNIFLFNNNIYLVGKIITRETDVKNTVVFSLQLLKNIHPAFIQHLQKKNPELIGNFKEEYSEFIENLPKKDSEFIKNFSEKDSEFIKNLLEKDPEFIKNLLEKYPEFIKNLPKEDDQSIKNTNTVENNYTWVLKIEEWGIEIENSQIYREYHIINKEGLYPYYPLFISHSSLLEGKIICINHLSLLFSRENLNYHSPDISSKEIRIAAIMPYFGECLQIPNFRFWNYLWSYFSPISNLEEIFRKTYRAIENIHQHHIYHLDIKPSNVLLSSDGNITLIDYGTAYYLESLKHIHRTYVGTLWFASPYLEVYLTPLSPYLISRGSYQYNELDDYVSCVYTFLYLYQGWLPWGYCRLITTHYLLQFDEYLLNKFDNRNKAFRFLEKYCYYLDMIDINIDDSLIDQIPSYVFIVKSIRNINNSRYLPPLQELKKMMIKIWIKMVNFDDPFHLVNRRLILCNNINLYDKISYSEGLENYIGWMLKILQPFPELPSWIENWEKISKLKKYLSKDNLLQYFSFA